MKKRKFLSLMAKLSVSAVAAFGGFIHIRSLIPRVLYEPDKKFKALPPDQFPEGVSFLQEQKVFIVKSKNTFRVLSAVCTHLGCIVKKADLVAAKKVKVHGKELVENWEFHCNCHGSKFYANGFNYSGPAPSSLPHFKVSISPDDGSLLIDKGIEVTQDEFLEAKV